MTWPLTASPATTPTTEILIEKGSVMVASKVMLSPSTLPFLTSVDPMAPDKVPVRASPAVARLRVISWAPMGELTVTFQSPSMLAMGISFS